MSKSLKVKRRRDLTVELLCSACLVISSALVVSAQELTELVLEQAKPVERTLAGEQLHKYTIALGPDQYMRLLARQNGVDIMLTVVDPAGRIDHQRIIDHEFNARLERIGGQRMAQPTATPDLR